MLGRIRAGVLEQGTVDLLDSAGAGVRMHAEGLPHTGFELSFDGDNHRIDLAGLTGRSVMVYGQTEVTRDLMALRARSGAVTVYEAKDVALHDVSGASPRVSFTADGQRARSSATSSPGATASTASPASSPGGEAERVRAGLPVRLARHPRGQAAARTS